MEQQYAELVEKRRQAMMRGDVKWVESHKRRIAELRNEIDSSKMQREVRLSEAMRGKVESAKNEVYKRLLRIALLSDVMTEAVCDCLAVLKKYDLIDFEFRPDVIEIGKLSKRVAEAVLMSESKILEDMLVDNEVVVDGCIDIVDGYLKEKMRL